MRSSPRVGGCLLRQGGTSPKSTGRAGIRTSVALDFSWWPQVQQRRLHAPGSSHLRIDRNRRSQRPIHRTCVRSEAPMSTRKRVPTDGGPAAWTSPFAGLAKQTVPPPPPDDKEPSASPPAAKSATRTPSAQPSTSPSNQPRPTAAARPHRGRVDLVRQTAHRGGKTVTVISGFLGISDDERSALAKAIQTACGCGGTVKEGRIEIQGDQRDTAARVLRKAGFLPVFAGG